MLAYIKSKRYVLREAEIERMEQSPLSPDMNPVEYVWEYLSRLIRFHLKHPMSIPNLETAVEE